MLSTLHSADTKILQIVGILVIFGVSEQNLSMHSYMNFGNLLTPKFVSFPILTMILQCFHIMELHNFGSLT